VVLEEKGNRRMTNYDVIERWLQKRIGCSSNLISDGVSLHSYEMRVAEWDPDRNGVNVLNWKSGSMPTVTTCRHVKLAYRRSVDQLGVFAVRLVDVLTRRSYTNG
jgi:hypothetical protein